jgi:hypothetical protein
MYKPFQPAVPEEIYMNNPVKKKAFDHPEKIPGKQSFQEQGLIIKKLPYPGFFRTSSKPYTYPVKETQ